MLDHVRGGTNMDTASVDTASGRVMAREKYRLAHRLGSGGMADVFRAEITGAEGFSRPVAIKRLHAGVSADPDFCAMFVREARLLAALQHPNVVSVLDFEWDAERRLFLVMELVDGINLAQLVGRGHLPVPAAVHVVAEVLRGLGHAHGRGILHRDVTPHNVLLAWTGEIKLSDFGLAKVSASSRVSDRGSIRGKVPYLSPEQLQGLTIDARSDLFSVGVMFYQLLTGCYPFFGRGDHPTMAESIARMLTAVVVPPRELRPEIPPGLSDVVMRMLARDREHRHADTEQALAALPAVPDGRKAVAALLAERFPGTAAGEPEAEPSAHASTPLAPRPVAQRDTTSLPAPLEASPMSSEQGGPQPAAGRSPRWRHSALLLVVAISLFGVAAVWLPRTAGNGTGAAVAVPAPRPAEIDAGARRIPVTAASVAAPVEDTPEDTADDSAAPPVRRARARQTPVRLSAISPATGPTAEPETGPVSGVEAGDSPTPSADAPVDEITVPGPGEPREAPDPRRHGGRYERGWTEALPQQAITGEIPIRRRERR
jgi:serine/threonine protein kinase